MKGELVSIPLPLCNHGWLGGLCHRPGSIHNIITAGSQMRWYLFQTNKIFKQKQNTKHKTKRHDGQNKYPNTTSTVLVQLQYI